MPSRRGCASAFIPIILPCSARRERMCSRNPPRIWRSYPYNGESLADIWPLGPSLHSWFPPLTSVIATVSPSLISSGIHASRFRIGRTYLPVTCAAAARSRFRGCAIFCRRRGGSCASLWLRTLLDGFWIGTVFNR